MQFNLLIAAAFILATIAVAITSPFEHLPQAPQQQSASGPVAALAPADEETADSDDGASTGDQQVSRADEDAYQ